MSRFISAPNKTSLTSMQTDTKQCDKLLFTSYQGKHAALLIQNDRLKAARFFPKEQSKIGAIYICKVKNAISNLNAYFVEIGGNNREICFLSQKDAAYPFLLNRPYDGRILEGDEFPVQVVRDAQKTKQASVTTLISLSNEHFAFSVGKSQTGYSNKFSDKEKKMMRQLIQEQKWTVPEIYLPFKNKTGEHQLLSMGLVVRTLAAQASSDVLENAFTSLTTTWKSLFQAAIHRTCFSCIKESRPFWQEVLTDLVASHEYQEILTDNSVLYQNILQSGVLAANKTLRLYDEIQNAQLSLSKLYALSSKIEDALKPRVWLKSGGYLIIEPTEALTVIDVNSGKYEAKKDSSEAFYLINREAAEEIALQLRLRNLSGIIIVDFINMKSSEQQEALLSYLRELVQKDKLKTSIVDMTPLGLVEITRKKEYKPLWEQID